MGKVNVALEANENLKYIERNIKCYLVKKCRATEIVSSGASNLDKKVSFLSFSKAGQTMLLILEECDGQLTAIKLPKRRGWS